MSVCDRTLKNFYSALQEIKVGVEINVGDLVFIDNRFALHSRGIFKPEYDNNDKPLRWIQRVFVSSSLLRQIAFKIQIFIFITGIKRPKLLVSFVSLRKSVLEVKTNFLKKC